MIYRILLLTLLFMGRCFAECEYCFPYDEVPCTPWNVAFSGEFLYFKAREDGLALGNIYDLGSPPREGSSNFTVLNPLNPFPETGITTSLSPVKELSLQLKPQWAKGFRVGMEIQPPESKLNLYGTYSYYKTRDHKSWVAVAAPNPFALPFLVGSFIDEHIHFINGLIPPLFATPGGVNQTSVKGFYDLKIQEYQLAISYALNFYDCFEFRPYTGFKGVLIDQLLNFDHSFRLTTTEGSTSYFETSHQRLRFYSFGLEGGMYGEWSIRKGFFSFGNLGLDLVVGRQQFYEKSAFTATNLVGVTIDGNFAVEREPSVLRACFDSTVGVGYKTPQICNFVRGIFRIAWENHIYFKQNFFAKVFNIANFEKTNLASGDLSTYGITISGELVF